MFRHSILPVILTLLLAACSKGDDDPGYGGRSCGVSFTVEDIMSTRGSVITGTAFPLTESFRVFATQTIGGVTTTLMDRDPTDAESNVVSNVSGYWAPKKRYFWPDGDGATASFYAVYPENCSIVKGTDNVTAGFTVPADVSSQKDMMVASSLNVAKTANGAVPLTFRHILSQVTFQGRISDGYSGWQVSVRSLKLCNVNSRGTYSFGSDAIAPATPAVLQDYQLVMPEAPVVLTSTAESVPLTSASDVAMLMPQTLTAWDRTTESSGTARPYTSGCYLAIGCTITDTEGTQVFTGNAYVPLAAEWLPSYRYTYCLEFGCGYNADGQLSVANILVSETIAPWTSAVGGSQEIEL